MRSNRLLQITGLAAVTTLAVDLWFEVRPEATPLWVARGALVVLAGFFAWAFFHNTRTALERPLASSVVLLAAQLLAAFLMTTNFLVVLAAEIPFVLAGWLGIGAFAIQALAMIGVVVALAGTDNIVLWPATRDLPLAGAAVLTALGAIAWQAFAFFAGYAAASEARARRALERTHGELLATQARLAEGSRAAERLRISRELHDRVGHHLALLSVHLEIAKQVGGNDRESPAAAAVRRAQAVARALLQEVRDVVSHLRSDRPLALAEALRLITEGVPDPRVVLDLPDDLPELDAETTLDLVRAAQELITNAIRHAEARTLRLSARVGPEGLELAAHDDGRGAPGFAVGHGLAGLRERIEARGGRVEIEPGGSGRGFAVRLLLPTSQRREVRA